MEVDLCNHYWLCDNGMVFSSVWGTCIDPGDAFYRQWRDLGGVPTPFPKDDSGQESMTMMNDMLEPLGLAIPGFEMGQQGAGEEVPPDDAAPSRYLLNTTKSTYHVTQCPDAMTGSLRTLAEIAEVNPDAKPCGKCRPPSLL